MACECVGVTLVELGIVTGLPPETIAATVGEGDLIDSWDGKPRVSVEFARRFVAEARIAQARHDAQVREWQAALAARGEERAAEVGKVYAETYRERLKASRSFHVKQLPIHEGVILMGGERLDRHAAERRLAERLSREEARDAAAQFGAEWDNRHPAPDFSTWISTRDGRAAVERVEAAIRAAETPTTHEEVLV